MELFFLSIVGVFNKQGAKMQYLKMLLLGLAFVSTPLVLSACEDESALEEGVEEVGDEIDDATTD